METKLAVLQLCDISEMKYYETIFNQGIEYLRYESNNDSFYVSKISYTREYWDWWLTIVEDRNKLFLKQFSGSYLTRNELIYIWESLLWVGSLRLYPPGIKWDAGYEQLIQKLKNHETRID